MRAGFDSTPLVSLADLVTVVRATDRVERNVAIVRSAIVAWSFQCARAWSRVVSTNGRSARPAGRSPAIAGDEHAEARRSDRADRDRFRVSASVHRMATVNQNGMSSYLDLLG